MGKSTFSTAKSNCSSEQRRQKFELIYDIVLCNFMIVVRTKILRCVDRLICDTLFALLSTVYSMSAKFVQTHDGFEILTEFRLAATFGFPACSCIFASTIHIPQPPCLHMIFVPMETRFSRRKSASDVDALNSFPAENAVENKNNHFIIRIQYSTKHNYIYNYSIPISYINPGRTCTHCTPFWRHT